MPSIPIRGSPSLRYRLRRLFRPLSTSVVSALPRLLFVAGLVAATYAAVGEGVQGLSAALDSVSTWHQAYAVHRTGDEAGRLFQDLADQQKLAFQGGRLVLGIDCGEVRSGALPTENATSTTLGQRLCQSDVGTSVLSEVAAWNRSGTVLAIRDDVHGQSCVDGSRPGAFIPAGCFPNSWSTAVAADRGPDGEVPFSSAEAVDPAPEIYGYLARSPHLGFGDWLSVDASAYPGKPIVLSIRIPPEITSAAGASSERRVTVDVIGRVAAIELNHFPAALTCASLSGRPRERVETVTALSPAAAPSPGTGRGGNCLYDPDPPVRSDEIQAWRIDLPVDRRSETEVRVTAYPAVAASRAIDRLLAAKFEQPPAGEVPRLAGRDLVALTRHVVAACEAADSDLIARPLGDVASPAGNIRLTPADPADAAHPQTLCQLAWRAGESTVAVRPGLVAIDAVGGIAPLRLTQVIDPSAPDSAVKDPAAGEKPRRIVATADARALGLTPILGIDDTDNLSLLGQLRPLTHAGQAERVFNLTIDPVAQCIAQTALREVLTRQAVPLPAGIAPFCDVGYPDALGDALLKKVGEALDAGFDRDRRAAVVLLDAGQAVGEDNGGGMDGVTGRILAAASLPQLESGLSLWDVAALDRFAPTASPLAARAWSQNDRFLAPGSAFKTVITLAAIDRAARGDRAVEQELAVGGPNPGLTAEELGQTFGKTYNFAWNTDHLEIPLDRGVKSRFKTISDDGHKQLCSDALDGGCARGRFGLRDALIRSTNIWFARLALALDEDVLGTRLPDGSMRDKPPAKVDFRSAAFEPLAIVRMARRVWPPVAYDLVPAMTLETGRGPLRGSRLYATPIDLDVERPTQPHLVSLALSGIGQTVQVTPLAMANVMASIATNQIVWPRLTPAAAPGSDQDRPLFPLTAEGLPPLDPTKAAALMRGFRQALGGVVNNPAGTAFGAFAQARELGHRVHGKTGTAEVGGETEVPNSVWFVGWVDGLGADAHAGRRVAFACVVTHADREGGKVCAPLIRVILTRLDAAWRPAK